MIKKFIKNINRILKIVLKQNESCKKRILCFLTCVKPNFLLKKFA